MRLSDKRLSALLGLLSLCTTAFVAPAHAITIDTGSGPDYGGGASLYDSRPAGTEYQRMAGMFSLSDSATITSVAGWMNWNYPGYVSFGLAANENGLPGAMLFGSAVDVPTTMLNQPDWRGSSSLEWHVAQGSYWLVIAAVQGQSAFGSMPTGPVANPLPGYAFDWTYSNGFTRIDSAQLGMRVFASAVPEAETILLWSLGLPFLALACSGRRRVVTRHFPVGDEPR